MTLALVVRRTIAAGARRLYDAWVSPAQLRAWWGPRGVTCSHAEVDLRVGGKLRLGNELPDGRTLWILGEFIEIVPGERLVYTWRVEPASEGSGEHERVTVRFEPRGPGATEVIVVHERIGSEPTRAGHEAGWDGCLDGLVAWVAAP
jgi:uncharacterized protein YndB with AHSA1/START domain